MIIKVPSLKYLLENIEDEEVQLFIMSLGVIWRDSFELNIEDKNEKMQQFLELMQEGVSD